MLEISSIGVVAGDSDSAKAALEALKKKYSLIKLNPANPKSAKAKGVDVIVALGGDGFMLHTLHSFMDTGIPIYGMNRGTIGFLLNNYNENGLKERLKNARQTIIHPLRMKAKTQTGKIIERLAINEVSLLRQTSQTAHIRIKMNGKVKLKDMVCDGVLVSTPAGSSAYNSSVGGPTIPLRAEILALTPISPFRPRRWGGALLPDDANIEFDILSAKKRPVSAVADFMAVKNVAKVSIAKAGDKEIKLLFDPGHSLEERIIKEQFIS